MMSSNLDPPSGLGRDGKTRLDSTIDPRPNLTQFNAASRRETKDGRPLALDKFFNRHPGARLGIVHERAPNRALPDAWSRCDDVQVGFLEATGFRIEIVETTWDA